VNRIFADSNYFLALLNNRDEFHTRAKEITPSVTCCLLTTTWVLAEVLDALSKLTYRKLVIDFVHNLRTDPDVIVFPATQELFDAGLELFSQRLDKE
jgi:predicted nucleic acid-binding protein